MYAVLLENLERQVATERQVAAVFIAAGAKKVDLPTFEDVRERFDAALFTEPRQVDTERDELLRALGVR